MRITLVIDIPSLKHTKEAQKFAAGLAEHIVEHYNEGNVIHRIITSVPKKNEAL